VSSRHYDVIVLGRSVGALSVAALLARREFRVLLLGQGERPPMYHVDAHLMCRRTFTMLSATSPCWKRILQELAQTQRFRRRIQPLDPMFVVLSGERRIAIPPDIELFYREVEREFPEVRQLVDEVYAMFAHVNAAADSAFEREAVWPPGSFWERLETGRIATSLPLVNAEQNDLLGKFPAGHPYRQIIWLPAMFATHAATPGEQLAAFALARLHGAWTRGVNSLVCGEQELERFLVERIEAHGGVCRLEHRAKSILVQRGVVCGVMQEGDEEPTGASSVVTALSGEHVAELSGGEGVTKGAQRDWPRLTASAGRFVVSLSVDQRALPDPLSQESFLIPRTDGTPNPRKPVVHLQRLDSGDYHPAQNDERAPALLVAETILPIRGPLTLLEARQAVLSTLRDQLPFLNEHLIAVDSPHDGLPAYEFSKRGVREIDRIHIKESKPGPEPMQPLWNVDPPGFLGLGGEPIRGPIPGTYLVGPSVLPALGQEGELLAAWGAARLITKYDKRRQKMRQKLWTKIETN